MLTPRYKGAHLLLSLRTLAAERMSANVATPDISEDVPEISVADGNLPQSPMEFHELAHRFPPRPTPALPRPATDRGMRNITTDQRTRRHSTWLSDWECT